MEQFSGLELEYLGSSEPENRARGGDDYQNDGGILQILRSAQDELTENGMRLQLLNV